MTNIDEGALNTSEAPPAFETDDQQPADLDTSAPQDDETGDQSLNGGGEGQEPAPVPYVRFKEVNDQLGQIKAWEPVTQFMRENGFETPEAFMAAVTQQREETQTRSSLDPIAARLTAKVNSGELDWETAETLWQAERDKVLANKDRAMYQDWQSGQQLEQARKNYPEMDEQYVTALAKATGRPIAQLAKESHEARVKFRDDAIAKYNADKGKQPAAPEGSGGPPPVPRGAPDPEKDPKGYLAWSDAQAELTQQRYGR